MKNKLTVAEPVSAYDAKTHLPSLIARTEKGERFIITRHGQPVAQLIPIEVENMSEVDEKLQHIANLRARLRAKGVTAKSAFGEIHNLKNMTHDGHRY